MYIHDSFLCSIKHNNLPIKAKCASLVRALTAAVKQVRTSRKQREFRFKKKRNARDGHTVSWTESSYFCGKTTETACKRFIPHVRIFFVNVLFVYCG